MTSKPISEHSASDEYEMNSALSRRTVLQTALAGALAATLGAELEAAASESATAGAQKARFPHFKSTPVSYLNVHMQDVFWAPRQKVVREVSVPWATAHMDAAGGLAGYTQKQAAYQTQIRVTEFEAIKFIEAMASVLGLQRDPDIEGLVRAWSQKLIASQASDGYLPIGFPSSLEPSERWKPVWWSHEDYALGHYLESSIAYREATTNRQMYDSAVRGIDHMAATFLGSDRAYAPGHQEIEQALMRLYGLTGEQKYLALCGWLIGQRGHHDRRSSYGKYSQDHLPVEHQRTIEGHAVRAAFLYNGVTEYVGATGHPGYREAVLAIWEDFVNHKMYLHGAGGVASAENEGYSAKPDFIPPWDCFGESCSVFGNFQWAHTLFRLTGDAAYIDVAERMLYNAFYASLSLAGDRYFYENMAQQDRPTARFAWHPVPCCPPNIVKLFAKVGGFFYSTDSHGIFVKHYGSSDAEIPFGRGVKLIQRANYPWSGEVMLEVQPHAPTDFALHLRIPSWARGHTLTVNGNPVKSTPQQGWLSVRRRWRSGDKVELNLPMMIERVTMPPRFKEYEGLVALQRGPIVYCIEQQDSPIPVQSLHLPEDASFTAEHHPDFLGGVTVLRGALRHTSFADGSRKDVPVTFIPYGVWNNRTPDCMWMWLPSKPGSPDTIPKDPPGEHPH